MDFGSKSKASKQTACPLYALPPEGMAQLKSASPHLQSSQLKVSLPTSNDLLKKNPSLVYLGSSIFVNSRYSQEDKQA